MLKKIFTAKQRGMMTRVLAVVMMFAMMIPAGAAASSNRVSVVNDLKNTLVSNTTQYKNTLNTCLSVSTEILTSKQVLRSLGLAAGSVSSGFATAGWNVATDADLICSLSQLEIARYATNKALKSADIVLSYRNKSLNNTTAIKFMEAYRDCAAWTQTAFKLMDPILDEYAQHAHKTKAQQAAVLSNYFVNGAFDGMLNGLGNVDKKAAVLIKWRDKCGNMSSFVNNVLPMFPAYDTYRSTYQSWQNIITKLKKM